jgi:hypothetical protein
MKNQHTFSLIAMTSLILLSFSSARAQKISAQVSVNTEQLMAESKVKLTPLQDQLSRYLNDFDYTDNNAHYNIPVQIDIFVTAATATSFEDRYDATIAVNSQNDFQAADKKWRFGYQQGSQLTHNDQFQSFTSLIDFYIYCLLGQEYDKKTKLGGDSYYQKAFQVAQLSKFSDVFEQGWKERTATAERYQSAPRKPYRELEYFYAQAQYRFRVDDRKTSGQYLRAIIIKLRNLQADDPATVRYYEVHHLEIARMLSTLGLQDQLQLLIGLDPAHVTDYQQFLQKSGGP